MMHVTVDIDGHVNAVEYFLPDIFNGIIEEDEIFGVVVAPGIAALGDLNAEGNMGAAVGVVLMWALTWPNSALGRTAFCQRVASIGGQWGGAEGGAADGVEPWMLVGCAGPRLVQVESDPDGNREFGFLVGEQLPDLLPEGGSGDRLDVVAAYDAVVVESVAAADRHFGR